MSEETPILAPVGRDDEIDEFGHLGDIKEVRSARLWRATIAELLGTFTLTTIGVAGTVMFHGNALVVASSWGLALAALIFVYEEISGAHFNPAISFAAFLSGKISLLRVIFFFFAQLIGSLLAVGVVQATLPSLYRDRVGVWAGVTKLEAGRVGSGLLLEVVLTFFLVYVDLAITENPAQPKVVKKVAAPFAIGAIYSAAILYGYHITGSSLSPVRSFASAAYSHYWANHWIYWLGPLIGSVAAAIIFKAFLYGNVNKTDDFIVERKKNKKKVSISARTF